MKNKPTSFALIRKTMQDRHTTTIVRRGFLTEEEALEHRAELERESSVGEYWRVVNDETTEVER